jgi:hypothetical protein
MEKSHRADSQKSAYPGQNDLGRAHHRRAFCGSFHLLEISHDLLSLLEFTLILKNGFYAALEFKSLAA